MDNTWATPLYFRAFENGVDLSIQAGTKYIGGHSDVMFGTVSANEATWPQLDRDGARARPLRRPRRHLSRAARPAHHGGAARPSPSGRARKSRAGSSSGPKSPACCIRRSTAIPATRSGSAISPARAGCSASCSSRSRRRRSTPSRRAHAVRHRRSWGGYESLAILFDCAHYPHRHQMGARRPDGALPYRARGHRRPDRRSRARLRGVRRCAFSVGDPNFLNNLRRRQGSLRLEIGSLDHSRPGLGFRPRAPANSSGVLATGSKPSAARRCWMSGSAMILTISR